MKQNLSHLTDIELHHKLKNARIALRTLADGFSDRLDAEQVIDRLMTPEDVLATITELAGKDPELMQLVIRASVMALVNVQAAAAVNTELKRRAVKGN